MRFIVQRFKQFSREIFKTIFPIKHFRSPISEKKSFHSIILNHKFHALVNPYPKFEISILQSQLSPVSYFHEIAEIEQNPDEKSELFVQILLKTNIHNSVEEIEKSLDECGLSVTEEFVQNVLRRHWSDWKSALIFFKWACKVSEYTLDSCIYNEMIDILGRMKRFDEITQLLDEMSQRKAFINEKTYGIVVHRYASAHKVEEATNFFYRRKEFGLELDLIAFQTLLMSLCRYKHVEAAESLFHSKKNEFRIDIKTMNIILNGWCVLGSLREAKRFWKDIILSQCKPDLYTYGIFINSLAKSGKLNTAVKLFKVMWGKGCPPDVAICNCIIDALCFKKRIPEALDVFQEMNEKTCHPNVATYNSLIKHLCKIMRMEKVYELLDEMERKKGPCLPNARTYGYLLKATKKPEEIAMILERMQKNGCSLNGDIYNLILKLYMDLDDQEKVRSTLIEMEKNGLGLDRRSYTVMIHGLFDHERTDDALSYYNEMISKGMVAEPRTNLLVNAMNRLKEGETGDPSGDNLARLSRRRRKKRVG